LLPLGAETPPLDSNYTSSDLLLVQIVARMNSAGLRFAIMVRLHIALDCGRESMRKMVKRFLNDNSGATAIEYGLIAGLIGVVIIGALTTAGTKVSAKFKAVGSALN
jgi:pilus assembly protein Flp/PilA